MLMWTCNVMSRRIMNFKERLSEDRKPRYSRGDPLRWPRDTLYQLKLPLTSPTGCGRPVGIVRLRTKTTELLLLVFVCVCVCVSEDVSFASGRGSLVWCLENGNELSSCDAKQFYTHVPKFQMNLLAPSARWKMKAVGSSVESVIVYHS
jgi:hypothetical protein